MEPNFIEYLTANEHIAYPFREDAAPLVDAWFEVDVTNPAPTAPKDFLSDAVILVPAANVGYLYLRSITCVSLTTYTFEIRDEAGTSLITFLVDITTPPAVHSVIQEYTTSDPIYAIRLLTGPTFVDYLTKIGTDLGVGNSVVFGQALPFETGVVEFRPERVTKVRFQDGITSTVYDLDQVVGLYEGFNVELEATEDSVAILAEPGSGEGRNNEDCGGSPAPSWYDTITSLQGAKPDSDGNINLKGSPCHRIQPDPANYRVLLYNDCEPCCLCEDYANVAKSLETRFDRLRVVWGKFNSLVGTVNGHVNEYNTTIFPAIRTFTFWGHIMSGSKEVGGRGTIQSSSMATMSLVLVNRCAEAITVFGSILWGEDIVLVSLRSEGVDPAVLASDGFTMVMQPFSELHFYWLVRGREGQTLEGMQAEVTADWTQDGDPKTLTRTIS